MATIKSQQNVIGGDILIRPKDYPDNSKNFPLKNLQPLDHESQQIINHKEVQAWTTRLWVVAQVIHEDTTINVKIIGYDQVKDKLVFSRTGWQTRGSWPEDEQQIMLSEKLARKLTVDLNDTIVVKSRTVPGGLNAMDYSISGIVRTNNVIADGFVIWMPINATAHLILSEQTVNQISLKLYDNSKANHFVNSLTSSKWKAKTATDELAEVLEINAFRKKAIGFFSFVLMAIAGTGIANTIIMATYERISEIGILRTLGMDKATIFLMFLMEGAFLGILAGLTGAAFGGGVNHHLHQTGIDLSQHLNNLGDLPFPTFIYTDFSQSSIVMAVGFGVIISMLASLWPAFHGMKVNPCIAIREE